VRVLETERLIVRHMEMSDVTALASVFGDPDVMRFGDGVKTNEWVREWLRRCIEDVEPNIGVAPWAVDEKHDSQTIGYCGLFYFPDIRGQSEIEIGYRLARDYWGRGLATEAVCAIRDYAFYMLKIPRLIAMIDPHNTASINVAEKAGFVYEKDVLLQGFTHADRIYANVRPEDARQGTSASSQPASGI
jgi:ribosomal-protein-alanine N-acetyltransferase